MPLNRNLGWQSLKRKEDMCGWGCNGGAAAEPCSIRSRVNRIWEAAAGEGQAL